MEINVFCLAAFIFSKFVYSSARVHALHTTPSKWQMYNISAHFIRKRKFAWSYFLSYIVVKFLRPLITFGTESFIFIQLNNEI